MSDERRVSRKEPITVTTEEGVFEAHPLQWRKRIDVGNKIVADYREALDKSIASIREGRQELPETFVDYPGEFGLLYPEGDREKFENLTFDEMIEVLAAGLDVNKLSDLRYMIDPNILAPEPQTQSNGASADGQKITSLPDSSSSESLLPTSSD